MFFSEMNEKKKIGLNENRLFKIFFQVLRKVKEIFNKWTLSIR